MCNFGVNLSSILRCFPKNLRSSQKKLRDRRSQRSRQISTLDDGYNHVDDADDVDDVGHDNYSADTSYHIREDRSHNACDAEGRC